MRDIRHAIRRFFQFAVLLFSASSFAYSDNAPGNGPRWACWYSPTHLSVECLLVRAPTAGQMERAAEVASKIDRRLPELVKVIWGSPEKLTGTPISIPLMSVPFEMEFVRLLAKSVMCGRWKDCSVHFDRNADGLGPVRAAALESGGNEAEILAEMDAQEMLLAHNEPALPPNSTKRIRGMATN